MSSKYINIYSASEVLSEYKHTLKVMMMSKTSEDLIRTKEEMEYLIFDVANNILKCDGIIYVYNIISSIKGSDSMLIRGMNEIYKLALQIAYLAAIANNSSIIQSIVRDDTKQAVKTTSDIIKKYYPFAYGKPYDRKNGNLSYMLGGYALQEYIEHLAEDDFDLKKYMEDLDNEKENDND